MPQSSLMAWLQQPQAGEEPSTIPEDHNEHLGSVPQEQNPLSRHDESTSTSQKEPTVPVKSPSFIKAHPPLPPNVDLRSCTKEDLPHLKRLISLLLPTPYPENFFKEIIEDPLTNELTLLAVWHDDPKMKGKSKGRLVGAMRCRLLAHPLSPNGQSHGKESRMLYLSTLALLSPYRSHGIATHLLHVLTRKAVDDHGITSVGAHVWEANEEGLVWYRKRGFRDVSREPNYYRRLDPHGAIVMQRNVSVVDRLGG